VSNIPELHWPDNGGKADAGNLLSYGRDVRFVAAELPFTTSRSSRMLLRDELDLD
jgi:hypothetical protein